MGPMSFEYRKTENYKLPIHFGLSLSTLTPKKEKLMFTIVRFPCQVLYDSRSYHIQGSKVYGAK
jgi:hypothetical protein